MARLVYLGTPALAVPPLEALVGAGHEVVLVVSGPDRRRGRGGTPSPSPVKAAALRLGLAVTDDLGELARCRAELGVVVAYGRLIPAGLLAVLPMVNMHFSLLPRWRGAAPLERAILAGDATTGVCLMALEEGLDTGPVYGCDTVEIGDADLESLRARLVDLGTARLVSLLSGGLASLPAPVPQAGPPTYAAKLTAADRELHFDRPAAELARVVRVGGAWTTFRGRRLVVHRAAPVAPAEGSGGSPPTRSPGGAPRGGEPGPAPGTLVGDAVACGEGWLALVEVQGEGGRAQEASSWARGVRPRPGERLGPP